MERRIMPRESLEARYEQYYKRLYNYFYFRAGSHHDAEDLVETVFEKVVENYPAYDAGKAPFDVWIFTIARNSLIDFTRKTQTAELPEDARADSNPEREVLESERDRALADAVAELPEREQSALAMKYFARLKNKEIARILGCSGVNTGVILHRALKKLRVILTEKGVSPYE
ncbi:MAG: sigma-70 family RNA polymerase sigma factor [Oscillospiraceae bacterium]|nr:sigma-70 family RNA polymerase sigma factor [Oscillospiraceae bacterium]